jgi:hypothetical protein
MNDPEKIGVLQSSRHTKNPIGKVYADKGYYGEPNRDFLHMNETLHR